MRLKMGEIGVMKKRQIVLYCVIMLILLTTSVFATIQGELNIKVTADDNVFYAGEEFIITIGLKDLVATEGIKSIEGYIDIDENVLENLTINSIITDSTGKVNIGTNNSLPVYDASNISSSSEKGVILNTNPVSGKGDYKLVINLDNPVSSDSDLVSIKFRIRSDVNPGTYEGVMSYKLFNVFATDAGEKLELGAKNYKITISEGTAPVVNNTVNNTVEPENVVTNNTVNNTSSTNNTNSAVNNTSRNNTVNNTSTNNTVNNTAKNNTVNNVTRNNTVNNTSKNNTANNAAKTTNTNKTTNTKTDSTVSPTKLPKTGLFRIILIPIIAIAIVGLVFYKKYAKYNKLDK